MRPSVFVKLMGALLLLVFIVLAAFFFMLKDLSPPPSASPIPPQRSLSIPPLSSPPTAPSVLSPPPPSPAPQKTAENTVPPELYKPLRHCIRTCSQEELLHFMENNPVDFHMQWREGRVFTVFDTIVRFRPETALHLLRMGQIVVSRHPQALSAAVISGNAELVSLLLALGADPNGHGSTGPSPLLLSITLGKVAIMDLLQASGSRMDPVYNRKNAMDLAVRSQKTRVSNLRRLVEEGFPIESQHIESTLRHGNLGSLAYLLKLRPDLRNMWHRNTDILSLAIQYNRPLSFIRYLHLTGSPLTAEHLDLARTLYEKKAGNKDPLSQKQARILEAILPYIQEQIQ